MCEKMGILARISTAVPGDVSRARKEAQKEGINLDIQNGWLSHPDAPSCFGPDPNLDNVWSNSPSLMLHAMDEGFVEKFPPPLSSGPSTTLKPAGRLECSRFGGLMLPSQKHTTNVL